MLMGETIGAGIVDSACIDTLSGEEWISIYCDSLSITDRKNVRSEYSIANFRFGNGPVIRSTRKVYLRAYWKYISNYRCTSG